MILGLASLGLWFVYAQLHTVLPVAMSRLGFSEAAYGMLWSLNAMLVVVLTPVLSALADRKGWSLATLLKDAISFSATVARIAPEDLRGTYQGLAGMLTSLGWMAGPLLGGAITDAWGTTTLWVVTVIVPLGALVGFRVADAVEAARSGTPRHA